MSNDPNTQPKLKLIPDNAIKEKNEDRFQHNVFVNWLLSALESTDKPINIGLFGKWGTGKTGILQLFQDRVETKPEYKEKYQYCYIDCWKISPEHIRQQLLLEINKLLGVFSHEYMINHFYRVTETRDSINTTKKLRERMGQLKETTMIFSIIVGVSLGIGFILDRFYPNTNILYAIAAFLFIPLLSHIVIKLTQSSKTQHIQQIPPIDSHEDFKKLFDRIISEKKIDKNNQKLIIALDNLDRCNGDIALEILSLVKSFMEKSHVFFIIPCDINAITEHVENRGNFFKNTARDFLRKFFQVSVNIPPITHNSMIDYVDNLVEQYNIDADDKVKFVISITFMDNPRRIKQFLNQYIANYYLALEMETSSESLQEGTITNHAGFLAKILVLQDMFPDFYDKLVEDANLLEYTEQYFNRKIPSSYAQDKIQLIKESSKLKEFLKHTQRIRVDDVRPFIRLAQDPHEQLPTYAEIRRNTQIGNNKELVEIVRLYPDRLGESLKIIEETINDDFNKGHYEFGAHGLNAILHIYEIAPESWKLKLAELFGMHASAEGIVNRDGDYDPRDVFKFIEKIPTAHRDILMSKYCRKLTTETHRDTLLSLLIRHSNLFSDDAKESFRDSMRYLYDKHESEAIKTINKYFKEDRLIELLDNQVIMSILAKMTTDISEENKQRISVYIKLKQLSDPHLKEDFIRRLFRIIPKPAPAQIDDNLSYVLEVLEELDHVDVNEAAMDTLYHALIDIENHIPDENQKIIILRPVLKHFHKLPDAMSAAFVNEKLPNYVMWSDPALTELLASMDLSEKKLLDREEIFNIIFDVVKNNGRRILFEYMIKNTTGDQREKTINLIISHIQSPNEAIRQQTCAVISNTYENLEEIDQLVPSIIDSSRHTEYPDRIRILTLLDKIFVKCSLNIQNTIALEFINLMKDANIRNVSRDCFNAIWPKLNDFQKSNTWDQLVKLLDDSEVDDAPGPFFELVIDESKITQNNYHGISKFLISKAEQGINKEIYLEYLSKLGNMVQFDDVTLEKINKLQNEA